MTSIVGYHHLSLSVTDLARSTTWYEEVLAMDIDEELEGPSFRRTRLRAPAGGITLTLTTHDEQVPGSFSERRAGMDHFAFQVGSMEDLHAFKARLEQLAIDHSEIKGRGEGRAMITLRDPDNIQLELFA